jgi:peptidoglycan/LPS O-acetylase OafA/YrhL
LQRQNIPSSNIDFNRENNITFYIPCLHGVRAFAIILVLISHSIHTGLPSWLAPALSFGNLGTIGVRLFFLLSGFLITRILQSELQKTGSINFRKFFIRRLLRIFPCFYFFILTLFLLSEIKVIEVDGTALLFALLYIQNFVVFQNTELFPTSWLVKHSWSLSVEEQFYLIYPFLVKPLLRKIILNPLFFLWLLP